MGGHGQDRAGAGVHRDGAGAAAVLLRPHVGQDAEDLVLLPVLRGLYQPVGGGGQGVIRQAIGRLGPQTLVQRVR